MRAIILRRDAATFSARVEDVELPVADASETVCSVVYSSLNYKDALAIRNKGPVVRHWPMVPGIDGACVLENKQETAPPESHGVILTGWGLGETRWGCLAEKVRVPERFLLNLPDNISLREAMAVGTAGLTAMLSILTIERHGVTPQDGPILITGASGGVGGMALMFLAGLGYETVASTGRPEESSYLSALGATRIIERKALAHPGKPLQQEQWIAAVDSVGSVTLANVCASVRYGGIVTACGLAQGMDFPSTVAPFILRGITLAGIDSVMAPQIAREAAWKKIAEILDRKKLERMTREIGLSEVADAAEELLAGRVRGRLVVNVRK